eukprot:jgi/Phyca11/118592/e_gw1.36.453.1
MDVSYVRGRKRDPRADSAVNVAFRLEYLKKKVSNLNARLYPKLTEIYLDESYCNVNHVAGASWVLKNAPRYMASGAGQRYCIGSIRCWPSHLKAGEDIDYHGNFTGEIFEKWFESLCILLEQYYGSCRIHMDGASYHKVIEDRAPVSSAVKAKMVEYLHSRGVTVSVDDYTRKQLYKLVLQVQTMATMF